MFLLQRNERISEYNDKTEKRIEFHYFICNFTETKAYNESYSVMLLNLDTRYDVSVILKSVMWDSGLRITFEFVNIRVRTFWFDGFFIYFNIIYFPPIIQISLKEHFSNNKKFAFILKANKQYLNDAQHLKFDNKPGHILTLLFHAFYVYFLACIC
jgi:hypothetical protein